MEKSAGARPTRSKDGEGGKKTKRGRKKTKSVRRETKTRSKSSTTKTDSKRNECLMRCSSCKKQGKLEEVTQVFPCLHAICQKCRPGAMGSRRCLVPNCYSLFPPVVVFKRSADNAGEPTKRKARKKVKNRKVTVCQGLSTCTTSATGEERLSSGACAHMACMGCLAEMLDECEKANSVPICPNEGCKEPFVSTATSALRQLFPDRSAYFDALQCVVAVEHSHLRDDTVRLIHWVVPRFKDAWLAEKPITIKVDLHPTTPASRACDCTGLSDVEFLPDGPLGDLLREVNAELAIDPSQKVFGYYVEKKSTGGKLQMLRTESLKDRISFHGIEAGVILTVDTRGVVQHRKAT